MQAKHVVVLEANTPGLYMLEQAKNRGYAVTFIRSERLRAYYSNELAEKIIPKIDRVIDIEDSTNIEELHAVVSKLAAEFPIDGLLCVWELAISAAAEISERLGLRFTSTAAVNLCRAKHLARDALDRAKLPSAQFGLVLSTDEALAVAARIGYPVIAKPASACGSKFAAAAYNEAELRHYVEDYWRYIDNEPAEFQALLSNGILIEEKLVGRMLSAEMIGDGQQIRLVTIGERKRAPNNEVLELGTTLPAPLNAECWQAVETYAIDVAKALGLDFGMCHLEIMLTERGPRLIEANPRVMGGNGRALIKSSYGVDVFDLLLDIHIENATFEAAWPAQAYTTAHIISGKLHQVLNQNNDFAWVKEYGEQIVLFSFNPKEGNILPEYRSNFDSIGSVLTRGDSAASAIATSEEVLRRIEQATGAQLIR